MTTLEVFLSETARRQVGELPLDFQVRIKERLRKLSNDPYRSEPGTDIKKLRGPKRNYYRLRIGNYRAIYVIDGNRVLVAKVLPRSRAYEWIE